MDPSEIYTDLEPYEIPMSTRNEANQGACPPEATVPKTTRNIKSRISLILIGVLMGLVLISISLNIWLVLNSGKCQGSRSTSGSTELVTCPSCPSPTTCTECPPAPTCPSSTSSRNCPSCPTCPPCISEPLCPTRFPLLRPGTNSCYRRENSATWPQAVERCEVYGGFLAAVETEQEDAWLYEVGAVGSRFWLGATDSEEEGKWVWIGTGQPVNYTHWAANYPRTASSHNVVVYNSVEGWVDYQSTSSFPFYCEIRAVE